MASGRLPEHEQRILDEMEAALDRDRRLGRRLRAVRLSCRLRAACVALPAVRAVVAAVTAPTALVLLVVAVVTSASGVIWAFVATWTCVLLCVRPGRRRAAPGGRPGAGGTRPGSGSGSGSGSGR